MADDLSLLFRIRAQNQASDVIKSLQKDIETLRKGTAGDFKEINLVATAALGRITSSITSAASSVPLLGNAVNQLSGGLNSLVTGLGEASGGLAALAGPAALAATAIAAVGAASVAVGAALFESAKAAAEYQGKLFDLSQQTGVTVETLSALEIAAEDSGGNIDSVAASLVIFQKNMAAAGDETSKQAKAFQTLGVTISDTETTFQDTLTALAGLPEGFQQTALAMELFGRGGKQVLAIIKDTGGDVARLKEELRDLGLVTTEQAKKADEFDAAMNRLKNQTRGLGTEVVPVATGALQDLSRFLQENKDSVGLVKDALGGLALTFTGPIRDALRITQVNITNVTTALEFLRLKAKEPIVIGIELKGTDPEGLKLLREAAAAGTPLGATRGEITAAATKAGLIKPTGGGGGSKVDAGLQLVKSLSAELRRLNDETRLQEVSAELLDKKYNKLNPTVREQILTIARIIDLKKQENDVDKELEKRADEREKNTRRRILEGAAFIDSQTEEINRLKGVTTSALDAATAALNEFGDILTDVERDLINANARTIQLLKNAKALQDALDNIDLTPGPTGGTLSKEIPFFDLGLGDAPAAPIKGLQGALDELGQSIENVTGASKNFSTDFGDLAIGAINDMAQGVGSLVEQWVLLGDTGPNAMRKMTASVLAGIAAQATVKAIFELAEGFAALSNPFTAYLAPGHFHSAALFGSIAGVSAVAGRAVAGNLFQGQGRSASGSFAQGQINPLTLERNQPGLTRTIVLQVQSNDSHIVKVVGANIREAGDLREIIFNDGVS